MLMPRFIGILFINVFGAYKSNYALFAQIREKCTKINISIFLEVKDTEEGETNNGDHCRITYEFSFDSLFLCHTDVFPNNELWITCLICN